MDEIEKRLGDVFDLMRVKAIVTAKDVTMQVISAEKPAEIEKAQAAVQASEPKPTNVQT